MKIDRHFYYVQIHTKKKEKKMSEDMRLFGVCPAFRMVDPSNAQFFAINNKQYCIDKHCVNKFIYTAHIKLKIYWNKPLFISI